MPALAGRIPAGHEGPLRRGMNRVMETLQNAYAWLIARLLRLRRAGLVEARRGRHGGYRLARPPAEIALQEVLAAQVDGLSELA